jgi:hypothetical protein
MCTDGVGCKRRVCFFAHAESELRWVAVLALVFACCTCCAAVSLPRLQFLQWLAGFAWAFLVESVLRVDPAVFRLAGSQRRTLSGCSSRCRQRWQQVGTGHTGSWHGNVEMKSLVVLVRPLHANSRL